MMYLIHSDVAPVNNVLVVNERSFPDPNGSDRKKDGIKNVGVKGHNMKD